MSAKAVRQDRRQFVGKGQATLNFALGSLPSIFALWL